MSPFCPFALSADFLLTTAEAQVSKHVFSTVKEVLWITPFVFWITASRSTALYSHHILKKGLFMGPLDFKTWRFYQFRIGVITCSRSWWVRFSTLIGLFLFFKLIFSRIKKNIYIYFKEKHCLLSKCFIPTLFCQTDCRQWNYPLPTMMEQTYPTKCSFKQRVG